MKLCRKNVLLVQNSKQIGELPHQFSKFSKVGPFITFWLWNLLFRKLNRIIFDFAVYCLCKGSTFFGCLFANNLGFQDAVWWCFSFKVLWFCCWCWIGSCSRGYESFDWGGRYVGLFLANTFLWAWILRHLRQNISLLRGVPLTMRHDIWLLAGCLTAILTIFLLFLRVFGHDICMECWNACFILFFLWGRPLLNGVKELRRNVVL